MYVQMHSEFTLGISFPDQKFIFEYEKKKSKKKSQIVSPVKSLPESHCNVILQV